MVIMFNFFLGSVPGLFTPTWALTWEHEDGGAQAAFISMWQTLKSSLGPDNPGFKSQFHPSLHFLGFEAEHDARCKHEMHNEREVPGTAQVFNKSSSSLPSPTSVSSSVTKHAMY